MRVFALPSLYTLRIKDTSVLRGSLECCREGSMFFGIFSKLPSRPRTGKYNHLNCFATLRERSGLGGGGRFFWLAIKTMGANQLQRYVVHSTTSLPDFSDDIKAQKGIRTSRPCLDTTAVHAVLPRCGTRYYFAVGHCRHNPCKYHSHRVSSCTNKAL